MKEKIKKTLILINRWKIILLILLIGAGLFYWYEYRPSQIRGKCASEIMKTVNKGIPYEGAQAVQAALDICLKRNGLAE